MWSIYIKNCSVMGYGTTISDYWILRFWSVETASIFWWPVKIDPECSSKRLLTVYQTNQGPNPDYTIQPYQSQYLKSYTKKY